MKISRKAKYLIPTVLFLAFAIWALYFKNGGTAEPRPLTADALQAAFAEFSSEPVAGRLLILMFQDPAEPEEPAVNLQFSVNDEDSISLDWLLKGDKNIDDGERFARFAAALGYEVKRTEERNIPSLRIEKGDLVALAGKVIFELYGLPSSEGLSALSLGYRPESY